MTTSLSTSLGKARWIQLSIEAMAFVLIGIFCAQTFATNDACAIVSAMLVAYAVPRFVYSRMRCSNTWGRAVLGIVSMVLVLIAITNIWSWTVSCGHTMQLPYLESDPRGYFAWALHHYDGSCPEGDTRFIGFPLMILGLWKLLGLSIVWPIAMNVMLTLLSVVIVGQTAARLLEGRAKLSGATLATITMAFLAVLCYFLSQGTQLLKEALNYFSFSLCAYAIARIKCADRSKWSRCWIDVLLFAAGAAIMALTRNSMNYFILIAVVISAFDDRRQWRYSLTLVALLLIAIGIGMHYSSFFSLDRQMRVVAGANNGGNVMQGIYTDDPQRYSYGALLGDYYHYPAWKKMLFAPLVSGVQFIRPFPWYSKGIIITEIFTRAQWGWYVVGGMALYFYIFMAWRRGRNMGFWALWPLVCFVGIAYASAGSVARYALPIQPFFAIIATWVVSQLLESRGRRSFTIFMASYAILLAAILIVCYNA